MYSNYPTYTEYLRARLVAMKQCAWPVPGGDGDGLTALRAYTLRTCIDTEGYGAPGNDWSDPVAYLRAICNLTNNLPESPEGCECEECRERRADASDRLIAQHAQMQARRLPETPTNFWQQPCARCGVMSFRARRVDDGLCVECNGGVW